jgi:hypothetical protein
LRATESKYGQRKDTIIHQKFQAPVVAPDAAAKKKKTREEKNAKVQRREGAKKKEESRK